MPRPSRFDPRWRVSNELRAWMLAASTSAGSVAMMEEAHEFYLARARKSALE